VKWLVRAPHACHMPKETVDQFIFNNKNAGHEMFNPKAKAKTKQNIYHIQEMGK